MILLDSVTKTYVGDRVPALDNVSLHVKPNEFVFVVGKSGAGKSTLIKMITKEERPDSGKIVVGGIDLSYVKKRHVPHYRRRLGVVFQDFKLLPRRTVYENVAFALEIAGMSNKTINNTVPKVLELVGLADQAKKFPSQLSGGQKQRVSIARSVARQPKILIADEPTANLDHLTTKEIIDLLKKINDYGTTLIVTTHNESIVNHLQKRVITMEDGRIISDQKTHGTYQLETKPEFQKPGEKLGQPRARVLSGQRPLNEVKIQKPGAKFVAPVRKVVTGATPVKTPVATAKMAKIAPKRAIATQNSATAKIAPKRATKTVKKVKKII